MRAVILGVSMLGVVPGGQPRRAPGCRQPACHHRRAARGRRAGADRHADGKQVDEHLAGAEKAVDVPLGLDGIPRRWWGKPGPTPTWHAWQIDGVTSEIAVERPSWYLAHCQQGVGLKTSLTRGRRCRRRRCSPTRSSAWPRHRRCAFKPIAPIRSARSDLDESGGRRRRGDQQGGRRDGVGGPDERPRAADASDACGRARQGGHPRRGLVSRAPEGRPVALLRGGDEALRHAAMPAESKATVPSPQARLLGDDVRQRFLRRRRRRRDPAAAT